MEIAIRVLRLFLAGKTSLTAQEIADLFGWSMFDTRVWLTESFGRADAAPIDPLLWSVCWVRASEAREWCKQRELSSPMLECDLMIESPGVPGWVRLANVLGALTLLRLKASHAG